MTLTTIFEKTKAHIKKADYAHHKEIYLISAFEI